MMVVLNRKSSVSAASMHRIMPKASSSKVDDRTARHHRDVTDATPNNPWDTSLQQQRHILDVRDSIIPSIVALRSLSMTMTIDTTDF
ncbi:hypothetical protein Zmor_006583 [Zophobas morio]|uniref:Uncharacterized protein n=1 Tax=Zophobas morio TaxID=2755281 RepID=A0AA38MNL1_9CUCU|nr:hypothetical protein Zmor_006583 [Zophobas morio]